MPPRWHGLTWVLPLAQALIDTPTSREGSLYAAVYLAIFNIVLWTWGYADMSGDSAQEKQRLLDIGFFQLLIHICPVAEEQMGEAAVLEMYFNAMPEIARNIAEPLTKVARNVPI